MAKAAALKGLTEKEFFDRFVAVDYFFVGEIPVYGLSPATENAPAGQEYPFNPLGQCIFYKEGKCEIHAAKPSECAAYDHTRRSKEAQEADRAAIVKAWESSQDEIVALLGRKPQFPDPSMDDAFTMMFGGVFG